MADICFQKVHAPTVLSYFTAYVSLLFTLISTATNILIIAAVIKDPFRRLRTPFSYFLVNLAFSDLLVGTITMPISVAIHLYEAEGAVQAWQFTLIHYSYFTSSTASVLSLAALSFDRYLAVASPIKHRQRMELSLKRCAVISLCIWIVAALFAALYFRTGYTNLLMVYVHSSVGITLMILILTYIKVFRSVQVSKENEVDEEEKKCMKSVIRKHTKAKREKAVTKVFLIILVAFLLTYIPAIIMIYILRFCVQCGCTFRHVLRDLQFLIISANAFVDPIICCVQLTPFKNAILWILRCNRASVETGVRQSMVSTISISSDEKQTTHCKPCTQSHSSDINSEQCQLTKNHEGNDSLTLYKT